MIAVPLDSLLLFPVGINLMNRSQVIIMDSHLNFIQRVTHPYLDFAFMQVITNDFS